MQEKISFYVEIENGNLTCYFFEIAISADSRVPATTQKHEIV